MKRSLVVFGGTPSLDKWYRALAKLVAAEPTPLRRGYQPFHGSSVTTVEPSSRHFDFSAWKGDKVLGAAVAGVMTKVTGIQDKGAATLLVSRALSNRFFAEHSPTLLPREIFQLDLATVDYTDRQWGTLLESLVGTLHDNNNTDKDGTTEFDEAIVELAEWLLKTANVTCPSTATTATKIPLVNLPNLRETNAKGLLLGRGGTVDSKQIGGPPHRPVFEATATWTGVQSTASGIGKRRDLENMAARDLLRKVMADTSTTTTKEASTSKQ